MSKHPSIGVCGDFEWDHYEAMFCRSLRRNGYIVQEFRFPWKLPALVRKLIYKFPIFSYLLFLNHLFLLFIILFSRLPVVFFWRPVILPPFFFRVLRFFEITVVIYHNDDPRVSDTSIFSRWYLFNKNVAVADISLFYRDKTMDEYRALCHGKIGLLYPFVEGVRFSASSNVLCLDHYPRGAFDLVFIGHYEEDGRLDLLTEVVRSGFTVRIYGSGWPQNYSDLGIHNASIFPVYGDSYLSALRSGTFALCLLSKKNRDQYTRRCFEIPLTGVVMISERSDFLEEFFAEGTDVIFFDNLYRLPLVLEDYLTTGSDLLLNISKCAYSKVINSQFEVDFLTKKFMQEFIIKT
jgi:spore maturation protein CgeB